MKNGRHIVERHEFGDYVIYITKGDNKKYPVISAYKRNEYGGLDFVNSLQITSDGRIIGLSPAGGNVPREIYEFMIKKAHEYGASFDRE